VDQSRINIERVEDFLLKYDVNEKTILNSKRTYFCLSTLRDHTFNKVSQMNFIMGWTKRCDTFTSRIMRKAKKGTFWINIYDYVMEGFQIKVGRRKTLIEREKIFSSSKKKEEVRDTKKEIGIELGPNLSLEGTILPPLRMQRQFFRYCDGQMLGAITEKNVKLGDGEEYRGFYAMGSWHTSKTDIESFGACAGAGVSHWRLLAKTRGALAELNFPKIHWKPTSSDVFTQGVNPHGNSGFYCSQLYGKNKKAAFNAACSMSQQIWNKICVKFKPDTSLWSVGGRSRIHYPDSDGNCAIRSRAVLGPEFCVSQIHQVFARPITDGLKVINAQDPSYPLHLGSDMYEGRFNQMANLASKFKKVVCFDWSRYDQTISKGHIVLAFAICRASFPVSKSIDNLFLFILSGFLVKRVVGDGGIIYKIKKGVATGDPFTSIINTLVNFITFAYLEDVCEVEFGFKKFYGDDTLLCTNTPDFNYQRLIDVSYSLFGMTLKLESSKGFEISDTIEDTACFLRFRSLYGLPGRSNKDLFKTICFFPKRYIRGWKEKLARGMSFLLCSPFDSQFISVIRGYCVKQITIPGKVYPDPTWLAHFNHQFDQYLSECRTFILSSTHNLEGLNEGNDRNWLPGRVEQEIVLSPLGKLIKYSN
jgi:hypothetical protein